MWINNKTVEWLDSMDLQDKNAKITLAKKHAPDYLAKWQERRKIWVIRYSTFQFHRKYYFGQEEEEMKLCLMILSVPWFMFNGLEYTAILSNFLTFITGSNSRLLRIPTDSIPPVRYPVLVSGASFPVAREFSSDFFTIIKGRCTNPSY
jgi:hypothetical protein